ncbi:MAG: hypothetical protein ACKOWF_00660, partial [Chloroflexota bacterium]
MIDRRKLLTGAVAGAGAMASGTGAARQPTRRARPIVIVIINDDMRASDWRSLPKTLRELK